MAREKILVKTKLAVPRIKTNTLHRMRLLRQLRKNLNKKLLVICGDAGYGKTTLLAQFCGEIKHPYMYFSLCSADNDLTTFFHYIVTGIRQTYPHFGDMTESVLEQTQDQEIIVGTFINEFFGLVHEEFYLIFDDFHNIQDNQSILRAMEYLIQHQPENMHIIITSRVIPPFDLSFYLTKRELFQMDTTALQFDREEIRSLLDGIHLSIPDAEIDRVNKHSQGWITAIQLIVQKIIMSGEDKAKETLNGYVASGEELFEYFAREVFEHQSVRVQDFMMGTSFLRTLTPKVCNYILRIRTSGSVLKKLERGHTFITQTTPGVYTYHPLFRAFINDRASKHYGNSRIRSLHAKIGKYFIEQNDFESAIDIYLQGMLFKKACSIVKKISEEYIQSSRFNRLLYWFSLIPGDTVQSDTTLQNIKASILWHTMQIDEALAIYTQVIQQAKKDQDRKNLFAAYYGAARINTNQGKFTDVVKDLKRCLTIPRIPKIQLVDIYNLLGICHIYLNEFIKAEDMFEKAANIMEKHGGIERNASLVNNLAIIAFTKGELERSVSMFRKLVRAHANPLAEAHIYANIALALIDLGRLKEARQALVSAFVSSRRFANTRAFHQFMLGLGFYHLEEHNFSRAESYFSRVLSMSQESQERLSEQKARHGLLKTYYLSRNTSAAQAVLNEVLKKDVLIPGVRNHDAFLLKGLIELQAGNFQEAEKTLLDALDMVQETEFKYSLTKNLYHCAFLYWKKGDSQSVQRYLPDALGMATKNGYDHFMVRQGWYSPGLLECAEEKGTQQGYAKKILNQVIKTSPITVTLLGSFEVSLYGHQRNASDWQTRKAQVMFAYCMLNRKRPIAKDVLISTFSSQDEPARADQDIRTTISRIQRALPWKRIIRYERGFYRIFHGLNIRIDAEEFDRLCSSVTGNGNPLDPGEVYHIQQALALYRGDFLVGFYDQWSDTMRHYFKDQYLVILNRLAEYYQNNTEYEKALKTFRRIVEKDPLHEKAHLGILHVLQALDRSRDAEEHYRKFREHIHKETGIDLPGTLAEYLNLR